MAIYKPSNLVPNLQEIDVYKEDGNAFSCQINTSGSSAQAYKIVISNGVGNVTIFDQNPTNLPILVRNKGQFSKKLAVKTVSGKQKIEIDGNQYDLEENQKIENGKDYQWGVRIYDSLVGSTRQPDTQVCTGFLVGSTKYVVWTDNSNDDEIINDRWVEFNTVGPNSIMPILEPNTDNLTLPKNGENFVERHKISLVEKELGWEKNITKIELDDNFTYNYKNGTQFYIYKCSSEHTQSNFFVEPNGEIERGMFVEIYDNTGEKKADKTKIIGYGEETGEIRLGQDLTFIPQNGWTYKLYKYDAVAKTYSEVAFGAGVSNIIGGVPVAGTYRVITNEWSDSIKQLFIQPNINIKTDETNPNEIVFENGTRLDITEKFDDDFPEKIIPGKRTNITIEKLDNTQWLLRYLREAIPRSQVPVIPKSNYTVYTDFMDSMPNAIVYGRTHPTIKINYKDLDNSKYWIRANSDIKAAYSALNYGEHLQIQFKDNGGYIEDKQNIVSYKSEANQEYDYLIDEIIIASALPDADFVDLKATIFNIDGSIIVDDVPIWNFLAIEYEKPKDWRDIEFQGAWTQTENVQIKSYKYRLYFVNVYDEEDLLVESEDYYNTSLEWKFRGFETGQRYKIELIVTDQYGNIFTKEEKFIVRYEILESVVPMKIVRPTLFNNFADENNDADASQKKKVAYEHAIYISLNAPAFAASTDAIIDGQLRQTIDDKDVTKDKLADLTTGKILHYSEVEDSENLIEIPEQFSFLTSVTFSGENNGRNTGFYYTFNGNQRKVIWEVVAQNPWEFWTKDINYNLAEALDTKLPNDKILLTLVGSNGDPKDEIKEIASYDSVTGQILMKEPFSTSNVSFNNITYRVLKESQGLQTIVDFPVGISDELTIGGDIYTLDSGSIDTYYSTDQIIGGKTVKVIETNNERLKLRLRKNGQEVQNCFKNSDTGLYNKNYFEIPVEVYKREDEGALDNVRFILQPAEGVKDIVTILPPLSDVEADEKYMLISDTVDYYSGLYTVKVNKIGEKYYESDTKMYLFMEELGSVYYRNEQGNLIEYTKEELRLDDNLVNVDGEVLWPNNDGQYLWMAESSTNKQEAASEIGEGRFNMYLRVFNDGTITCDIINARGE